MNVVSRNLWACMVGMYLAGPLSQASAQSPVGPAAPLATSSNGMVAAEEVLASRVGIEILKKGGNAVDAAVGVAFALAVTLPTAGNLGGGGFMTIRMADGRSLVVDYREMAPALARRDMFLDASGQVVQDRATTGYLASGVPGTVAGLSAALEAHGTMQWAQLIEPARKLAAEGFVATPGFIKRLDQFRGRAARFHETSRVFFRNGRSYEVGERFRQPDLAATLKRLQVNGPQEFYEGRTARLLAADMKAHGGLITTDDLKRYQPQLREPLKGTYRGYEIITAPPASSGGTTLLAILNMLEPHPLGDLSPDSDARNHLLIEAMRRAYADRADHLGDPAFTRVPVRGLVSKKYAAAAFASFDPQRATLSLDLARPVPARYESPQTTHYSVVDRMGNAVAHTTTLRNAFGSAVTIKGAGFLMNSTMDDFASKPGVANGSGSITNGLNAVEPGKRPLSSMTPTIVVKDGKFWLSVGAVGSQTIQNSVAQVLVNLIDHQMPLNQALAAPRVYHQWLPDKVDYEAGALSAAAIASLKSKGHFLAERRKRPIGLVQAVMVDRDGQKLGATDPRYSEALAVGY